MDIFKYKKIAMYMVYIGFAAFLISWAPLQNSILVWTLLGIAIIAAVVSGYIIKRYWKCPNCGKPLDNSFKTLRAKSIVCENCGTQLIAK